ncbi:MAG: divalent-cation tolerance protein CutA [Planctomycetota bacterium]
MDKHIVVFVTAPNGEEAAKIARAVVEERLVACGNITQGIRSIYRWQGKVCDDAEVLLIMKTRRDLFERLAARVKELHSYEVPEIIALPIVAGSAAYLKWIDEQTLSP